MEKAGALLHQAKSIGEQIRDLQMVLAMDALDMLFEQVGRPNLIQALDFGNWPAERRYESVERSTHRAGIIHPKTHDFDKHGEQPEWDTYRMAREVMQSGFEGPWVIEFEGKTGDTFEGIQLTIDMIKRCWGVLETVEA